MAHSGTRHILDFAREAGRRIHSRVPHRATEIAETDSNLSDLGDLSNGGLGECVKFPNRLIVVVVSSLISKYFCCMD